MESYLRSGDLLKKSDAEPADVVGTQPISAQKKHADAGKIRLLIDRFDSDAAIEGINELLGCKLEPADRAALRKALAMLQDYDFDGASQALSAL